MTAKTNEKPPTGLELLRQPFPPHQISKLPKETKAQIDQRKASRDWMVFNCPICGGHHHKNAVHLDYVGHAALTDRLLDADPHWYWEPYVASGLPNPGNGMWIKLYVCGQSQIGYGHADGKSGGDAIKEIIGDALRNAAMRFGAALDLWHKGDLHGTGDNDADAHTPEVMGGPEMMSDADCTLILQLIEATSTDARKFCQAFKIASVKELPADAFPKAKAMLEKKLADKIKQTEIIPADTLTDDAAFLGEGA
jgi:hypothetical protein